MSNNRSQNAAAWLNGVSAAASALGAVASALAAIASYNISKLQTEASISEKRIRPSILWHGHSNRNRQKVTVKGNLQYARDVSVVSYNVLFSRYVVNLGEKQKLGPVRYFPLRMHQNKCDNKKDKDSSVFQECSIDTTSSKFYMHVFRASSKHFAKCLPPNEKLSLNVFSMIQTTYTDYNDNMTSEYVTLKPEEKYFSAVPQRIADQMDPERIYANNPYDIIDLMKDEPGYDALTEIKQSVSDDLMYFAKEIVACPFQKDLTNKVGRIAFSDVVSGKQPWE